MSYQVYLEQTQQLCSVHTCTLDSILAKEIQKVVSEETDRLSLKAKVIEKGGVSMKNKLLRMDLTGCPYNDSYLCEAGLKGASHTRSGITYSGTCTLCEAKK